MTRALNPSRISYLNLTRKPFRSIALTAIVAVLSFALFGGTILSLSFKNGLDSVKARFGADIIVVPSGHEGAQEAILLSGEPTCFYFNKSVVDALKEVEGISKITTQFYLTSMSASCCDLPLQIIGFDPATDFTIQPWILETTQTEITDGQLIVGSDIVLFDHNYLKIYGSEYPVAAQLAKTGTGIDQSVYASFDTIKVMFEAAKAKGMFFTPDTSVETSVSSVMIKVEEGCDIEKVIGGLRSAADDIQIIRTQSMITNLTSSINGFGTFLYIFCFVFLIMILIILAMVFSNMVNERKKEFAILRILGATRIKLAKILLYESCYISMAGSLTGTCIAALFVFPFSVYISDSLGLPAILPSVVSVITVLVCTIALSFLAGPVTSVYHAVKISRIEPYLVLRDGE